MDTDRACGGSCHCGAIRFTLASRPTEVASCNCSICTKHGGLWTYCPPADFNVDRGAELLGSYIWGDRLIAIRFCPRCACVVHWHAIEGREVFAPGTPAKVGVNARLLDGLDATRLPRRMLDNRST